MRCLPDLALKSDSPFWVTRDAFLNHFDQADFLCRESQNVIPAYLAEWFYTPGDGTTRFRLPTVMFVAGKTQFISGRHRTAVLLPFLKELPLAFSAINMPPQGFLSRLAMRALALDEFIELPNLPVAAIMP